MCVKKFENIYLDKYVNIYQTEFNFALESFIY